MALSGEFKEKGGGGILSPSEGLKKRRFTAWASQERRKPRGSMKNKCFLKERGVSYKKRKLFRQRSNGREVAQTQGGENREKKT